MTVEVPSPDRLIPPKKPKNAEAHRMYLPAVYRYSCLGAFSASSLHHGSVGKCRGMSSSLEHLLDMNPSTRAEAITNFTGEGVDMEDDVGLIEDGRPNPALIYPPPRIPLASATTTKRAVDSKNPQQPQEQMIMDNNNDDNDETKILKETWTAFGSTEVELLQLTDLKTGQTEIVAVSPYNAAIVSSRKLEMLDRTVSSTEFGIGPYKMQFLIESGVMREDSLEENEQQPQHALPPALDKLRREDNKPIEKKKNEQPSEEVYDPSNAIIPTFENAQQFYSSSAVFMGKMYNFSEKIVDKMQSNASWLYQNVQDDFPARTAASGRRILEQMPKSAALLTRVFKQIFGHDDGDGKS